jgi:putative flippase GtrA
MDLKSSQLSSAGPRSPAERNSMKPLFPSKPAAAQEARETGRTSTAVNDAPRGPKAPAAPGPISSFARFVLCGGGVGVLSSTAVPLTALLMPWTLANAVITIVSTVLCTELHARFTFRTGHGAGWRRHWQSAGSAAAAYIATCAAMFLLHLVQPAPGMATEQVTYLSASALAGTGRFLLLRLCVFADGRVLTTISHQSGRDHRTGAVGCIDQPAARARAQGPGRQRRGDRSVPSLTVVAHQSFGSSRTSRSTAHAAEACAT